MYVYKSTLNSAQLRRDSLDSEPSEKSKGSALESARVPRNSGSTADGQVLRDLGDKASDEFKTVDARSDDTKISNGLTSGGLTSGGLINGIKDIINTIKSEDSEATDTRAAELFEAVDTENPTLTTNEGGFDVNASQGPEDSTYIDLGGGAEVFVITEPSGQQVAYRVENGELGERIPTDGRTDIGNGIYVSIDESPAGESEVNFRQDSGSFPNPFRPDPKMTLNSDNSMLTTKNRERGSGWNIFGSTEVNSFDIQSGEQLVADGEADLDKMTPQQQFDYYADTPQGAKILRIEGNHYDNPAEQRVLVARAQYARGEGGPELFHEFTPGRADLSGADLVAYDAAVQDMMDEIREQGVYSAEGPDGPGINNSIDLEEPIDESMLYLMAASAVEAYGDNPEALEAIRGDINKWIISTDNADASGRGSSGWYRSSTGEVQFSIERLISDLPKPDHHQRFAQTRSSP